MCRGAVGSQHQQGWNLAEGMGYSIYFMLAAPFCLLGGFAALLYWKVRRAKKLGKKLGTQTNFRRGNWFVSLIFLLQAVPFREVGRLERPIAIAPDVRWISVENHAGSVRLRQGPSGRAEIRARVEASSPVAERAGGASFEREVSLKSEGGGLRIRNAHMDAGDAGQWRIHWELVLPEELSFSVENGAGDLEVEGGGLKGSLTLRTGAGNVAVSADAAEGGLRAATGSGEVRLELRRAPSRAVDLQTGGGRIRIALPAAYDGRVELETESGEIQARGAGELRIEPRGGRGAQLRGALGKGTGLIRAQTSRGEILFSRI